MGLPPVPFANPDPERLDWVWLEAISPGDKSFPAGFPSTTNEALRREGPRWVLTQGYYVADWIEAHCVYTDGKWISRPTKLMAWEERLLVEGFEVDHGSLLRRYRWWLVGLPKKNGKTELAAWLGLYMLHGDQEPAPFVVAVAASEEQADLVFGAASTCVELSPDLRQVMKAEAKRIILPGVPRARMQRVAAAAGTNDGKNIHCVICDELHEFAPGKHEQVWNILTNGLGARDQPIVIQITTAGNDEETVCKRQYDLLVEIRDGAIVDDTFYGVWFEAPRFYPDGRVDVDGQRVEVPYDSEDAIRLSNPSFGVTMTMKFFEDQRRKKTEAVYRRYFLNQWTEADEIWEGAQHWDDCAGVPMLRKYDPLCVGIDIAHRHDATAIVYGQWNEQDGKCHIRQSIWENPYGPRDARHATWRLDLREVEDYLRELHTSFPEPAREDEEDNPLPGPAFFYDPMLFERSAQVLRDDGLNMLEYPQSELRMTEASQRLFELVKGGLLVHDGDEVMRRHIRSTAVKETNRGWRMTRSSGTRRPNDGAIAGAIATLEATRGIALDDWDTVPQLSFGDAAPVDREIAGTQPAPRTQTGPEPGQQTYRFFYTDGEIELIYAPNQALAVGAAVGLAEGKRLMRAELLADQPTGS